MLKNVAIRMCLRQCKNPLFLSNRQKREDSLRPHRLNSPKILLIILCHKRNVNNNKKTSMPRFFTLYGIGGIHTKKTALPSDGGRKVRHHNVKVINNDGTQNANDIVIVLVACFNFRFGCSCRHLRRFHCPFDFCFIFWLVGKARN